MISQTQTCPLANLVANGSNAAVEVVCWARKTVFVFGTFSASAQVEISPDGTTWYPVGAALTAKGFVEVSAPCTHVRVTVSGFVSGTVQSLVAGY